MPANVEDRVAVDTPECRTRSSRSPRLHRLMWSTAWDVAMRGVGILWTGFLLLISVGNLIAFIEGQHVQTMSAVVVATAIAARVAFVTFLLLLLLLFIVRLGPVAKVPGVGARLVALAGTFLPTFLGFLPRDDESAVLNLASFSCIAAGNALSVYGLSHLHRSASIMAEARRLVTSGPYRFVQHPVYVFEALAVVGVMLPHLWPPWVAAIALPIFAAYVWCQLRRMRNEESVLDATFPEYTGYRKRTARLVPGLY